LNAEEKLDEVKDLENDLRITYGADKKLEKDDQFAMKE
jgi:hypothetical protein